MGLIPHFKLHHTLCYGKSIFNVNHIKCECDFNLFSTMNVFVPVWNVFLKEFPVVNENKCDLDECESWHYFASLF